MFQFALSIPSSPALPINYPFPKFEGKTPPAEIKRPLKTSIRRVKEGRVSSRFSVRSSEEAKKRVEQISTHETLRHQKVARHQLFKQLGIYDPINKGMVGPIKRLLDKIQPPLSHQEKRIKVKRTRQNRDRIREKNEAEILANPNPFTNPKAARKKYTPEQRRSRYFGSIFSAKAPEEFERRLQSSSAQGLKEYLDSQEETYITNLMLSSESEAEVHKKAAAITKKFIDEAYPNTALRLIRKEMKEAVYTHQELTESQRKSANALKVLDRLKPFELQASLAVLRSRFPNQEGVINSPAFQEGFKQALPYHDLSQAISNADETEGYRRQLRRSFAGLAGSFGQLQPGQYQRFQNGQLATMAEGCQELPYYNALQEHIDQLGKQREPNL